MKIYIKTFLNHEDYQIESRAYHILAGKDYLPLLIAEHDDSMDIEEIEGKRLIEFVDEHDRMPHSFLQNVYRILTDMISCGIEDGDGRKLDAHYFIMENESLKKIDYGISSFSENDDQIKTWNRICNQLFACVLSDMSEKESADSRDNIAQRLELYGIDKRIVDDYFAMTQKIESITS